MAIVRIVITRGGSRKKYFGGGLAPHHLGGNNEQNYCVQLSSIKQLMYRNYPENLGGLGKIWGPVPPGPSLEPPLVITAYWPTTVSSSEIILKISCL